MLSYLWNRDPKTGQLLSTPIIDPFTHQVTGQQPSVTPIASSYKGKLDHYDPTQWANHFPA